MKNIIKVLLITFLLSTTAFANEVVKLAIGEWAPYTSSTDPNGKIAETIVKEAFQLENIDIELSYYPWKRSYMLANTGKSDGTFPWTMSDKRATDFIISKEPIIQTKTVFFHLKSLDFDWNNYEDLKKYKIGGTLGYLDIEILEKQGLKIDVVSKEFLNYKKILAGRIDIYPGTFIVGYDMIYKEFAPEKAALFTNHPKSLREKPMYLFISKNIDNGQELADKFDSGMKKLKESGRYDEIITEALNTK